MQDIDTLESFGPVVSRIGSTAATGVTALDVAYNLHTGKCVDAGFGTADVVVDLALADKLGLPGLAGGVVLDLFGGTKALATGGASMLCWGAALFGSTPSP